VENLHPGFLVGLLVFLLLCSAFFSSSETGMLSLNRYRLRHQAKEGHRGAQRASELLAHPDRLLGTILVGNNFVNILASSIATVLAMQLWGEAGIAIATIGLTIILLIFGEITPKTLAALRPEIVAYPVSLPLKLLQKVLYPLVAMLGWVSNGLLKLLGVHRGATQRRTRIRHRPAAESPEHAARHSRPGAGHCRRHHDSAQRGYRDRSR